MQMNLRLADFIRSNSESILEDWEQFLKTILNATDLDTVDLRDHARNMLLVIADDIDPNQTASERIVKSRVRAPKSEEKSWAEVHGRDRQTSGFEVIETVSEFRALRASVVSHWTKSNPTVSGQQLEDLTRFHEAIDQAVAESLETYTSVKEIETRLFGAVVVASPDPIYVLNLEGRFVFANEAVSELFDLDPDAVVGKNHFDLGFPFAVDVQRNLDKVVADQSTYRGKFAHTFSSGRGERFEYLLVPILDAHQHTESVVCIVRDVTERVLAEEELWHEAHHDPLTGLPNRRLFLDRLEQEVKHAKRNGLPLAVLFMDLNGFKEVNDSLGHEVGDRLLYRVAERIIDCLREEDTVARLGGDEFTVIIGGANRRADAELVAQTILDTFNNPFQVAQHSVRISVSIGISFYPQDASSSAALLESADRVMYEAKQSDSKRTPLYATGAGNDG